MINWFRDIYARVDERHSKYTRIARFIISGGLAAGTNLVSLFIMTHYLGMWYLLSSTIAFLLSFAVSFTLQKFWTFRDDSRDRIGRQASIYFAVLIAGLIANAAFVYAFVEYIGLHYLLAAILSGAIIAFFNYIVYKRYIFNQ